MAKFGLITEGITDQIVIENILCGFYKDHDDLDEDISPLEPPLDETDTKQAYSDFGTGWSAIFNYLSETRFRDDVLNSEYVIIQIDTDIAEEMGCSKTQSIEKIIECVISQMVDKIDKFFLNNIVKLKWKEFSSKLTFKDYLYQLNNFNFFYSKYRKKIIFAISVHSLECWILPLYSKKQNLNKCEDKLKYTIATSSKKIQKLKVSKKDGNARNNYDKLTQGFLTHKKLMKVVSQNSSFEIFVNKLPKTI